MALGVQLQIYFWIILSVNILLYHVGVNNMFRNPSKETIDRINTYIEKQYENDKKNKKDKNKEKGKIYRTDLLGEVVICLE